MAKEEGCPESDLQCHLSILTYHPRPLLPLSTSLPSSIGRFPIQIGWPQKMHFLPDIYLGDSEKPRPIHGLTITKLLLSTQSLEREDIVNGTARMQAGVAVVVAAMVSGKSCYG